MLSSVSCRRRSQLPREDILPLSFSLILSTRVANYVIFCQQVPLPGVVSYTISEFQLAVKLYMCFPHSSSLEQPFLVGSRTWMNFDQPIYALSLMGQCLPYTGY